MFIMGQYQVSASGPSGPLVSKLTFSKNSYRNAIRMSNGLDPDQDQQAVCKGYQQMTKVAVARKELFYCPVS